MEQNQVNSLVNHIEKHLGKIISSWKLIDDKEGLQIIKFSETPAKSISTFITLGLSNHLLNFPSGKTCHQELVICVNENSHTEDLASTLIMLSKRISTSHKAILRGGIEDIGHPLTQDTEMSCLYATIPFFFPESFDLLSNATHSIMFPLLIPIYKREAEVISKNNQGYFERILDEQEPDFFDLKRPLLNLV